MKRITLAAIAICGFVLGVQGQANYNHIAPPNGSGTSAFRAPNGSQDHAKMKALFYIHPYEMLPMNLATINSTSFQLISGTGSIPVTGNFTLYLGNSDDIQHEWPTYTYATYFNTMTAVYVGSMTVPGAAGAQTIGLNFTTPFNYTGGGMYVGYNWDSPGPYSAGSATYAMNYYFAAPHGTDQVSWMGTAQSSLSTISSTVEALSTFRPAMIWGAANTATNDVEVIDIDADGASSAYIPGPQQIWSRVVNSGHTAVSNLSVVLNVTGTNPHTETVVVPSLAAGATTTVNFVNYSPTMKGTSDMTVAALYPDQNLANNLKTWSQDITCRNIAQHPEGYTYDNAYSFNSTAIWSSKHNLANSATLTGVDVAIYSHAQNNKTLMYAVLLDAGGNVMATGSPVQIAPSTTVNFPFNTPQSLNANTDYYIGVVQPTASPAYYPMAFKTYTNFVARPYYTFPVTGGPPAPSYYFGYFGMSPVLQFDALTINATASPTLACMGDVVTYSVNAQPGMTYTWKHASDPAQMGTVISPTVKPAGTATGSPVFTNISGLDSLTGCATETAVITISVNICTGIGDVRADYSDIRLFPNPAVSGKTTVNGLGGENTIEVINIVGQTVLRIKSAKENEEIDLSNMAPGQYMVKVTNNKQQIKVFKVLNE